MEVDDMNILRSEEEENDEEAELDKLLSGLNGMEKCLIPVGPVPEKATSEQAGKQIVTKTVHSSETNNNNIFKNNQTKSASETTSKFTEAHAISVKRIIYDVDYNNAVEAISPTNSEASTLSREPTPEKELSYYPKDKETTTAQILDNDSDSDVIVEHVTEYCKESTSQSVQKSKDCTSLHNFESDPKSNDTIQLDDVETSSKNLHFEVEAPSVSAEIQNKANDSDSDSDCLIVEHIAASEHLQNGCIDLTKPADDEEASFALTNRSEQELVEEIIKIRRALHKHDKKRHRKERKSKHRRSPKKKKISKSKSRARSPSFDEVSEFEDEIRTITHSKQSSPLSFNIVSVENEVNQASVSESRPESSNLDSQIPHPEIAASTKVTNPADSPPLWDSDGENMEVKDNSTEAISTNSLKKNENSTTKIEKNPLKRRLSYQVSVHTNLSSGPIKRQVFCESSRELQSNSRRNNTAKTKCGRVSPNVRAGREVPFEKTNSFNTFLSDSDENDLHSRTSPSNLGIAGRLSSNLGRSKSAHKSPSPYRRGRSPPCYRRRNRSSCRSPVLSSRAKSRQKTPSKTRDLKYRTGSISRSRSPFSRSFRSKSRSGRSKSRTYRSPSPAHSRCSRSRAYSSSSRSRRSRSRAYRSPSPYRSRRSKSKTYRSPSRSLRSKSRNYRNPSHLRRSKSPGRRSKSRHRTPRIRSSSRSPSEIRAARKCSPLESMRQQLRKNNEVAVQQALGNLEKPPNSGGSKICSARIIDDVDLTKSSPSPEKRIEPLVMNRKAPTGLTFASATAIQYTAALQQHRLAVPQHPIVRMRSIPLNLARMPVPVSMNPGVLNQMDVYSQTVGFPEHYVPVYTQHLPLICSEKDICDNFQSFA